MPAKRKSAVVLAFALIIYVANTMWAHPAVPVSRRSSLPANSSRADSNPTDVKPADSNQFVGSAACASCHAAIYSTHILTAHYRDSRPAAASFIKGSFDKKRNRFAYNSHMEVVMEQKNGRFFQTAYFNGAMMESESIDVVIGSGRKGQTYLYWDGDRLFQLPVSYYSPTNSWCNSPNYPTNLIYFNKQVGLQCIECHGTVARAEERPDSGTVFDKAGILYGIDCERCHGPGGNHIAFHLAHPGQKAGRFILNAMHMTRQQRLDACALCHSGLRTPIQRPFGFEVGDTLDHYSTPGYAADTVGLLDVHANQYGLLTSSKCFRMSEMDCSTCHHVHVNEVNSPQVFSTRCMNCHNESTHSTCSLPAVRQQGLYSNCIDCHMPALPSRKIVLGLSGLDTSIQDLVRTHRVGIYPASSKRYLENRRK